MLKKISVILVPEKYEIEGNVVRGHHETKNLVNRPLKWFAYVVSFSFALWSFTELIILYSKTTNNDYIARMLPSDIKVPKITFCFPYKIISNDIKAKFSIYNQTLAAETGTVYWNQLLSIETINNLVPDFENFTSYCKALSPSTLNHLDCDVLGKISHSINDQFKCFTLFETVKTRLEYQRELFSNAYYMKIRFLKNMIHGTHISVYIHYDDLPSGMSRGRTTYLEVEKSLITKIYLGWNVYDISREEIQDNCLNYTALDCKTRLKCIDDCISNAYLSKVSKWPKMVLMNVNKNPNYRNSKFGSIDLPELIDNCNQIYSRPECEESYIYEIKLIRIKYDDNWIENENASDIITFELYPPLGNKYTLKSQSIDFSELITMLMGSLGLASDISFLFFLLKTVEMLRNFVTRRVFRISSKLKKMVDWFEHDMMPNEFNKIVLINYRIKEIIKKLSLILKTALTLIIVVSFAIHFTIIHKNFLTYPSITNPDTVDGNFTIPSFTICYPYFRDPDNEDIHDIIKSWKSHESIIFNCIVYLPSGSTESCSNYLRVTEYLTHWFRCFKYSARIFNSVEYIKKKMVGKTLVELIVNTSSSKRSTIGISVQAKRNLIQAMPGAPSYIEFDSKYLDEVVISYQSSKNILLPAPYQTNCSNYVNHTDQCNDELTCIDSCVIKQFKDDHNLLPADTFIEYSRIIKDNMTFDYKNLFKAQRLEIRDSCSKSYEYPDCTRLINELFLIEQSIGTNNPYLFKIKIISPFQSEKLITFIPKLTIENFYSFMGSLVNVYFGTSYYFLLSIFVVFIWKLFKATFRNIITNN